MTDLPEDIDHEVRQARAAKGQTTRARAETQREIVDLSPIWAALRTRRLENSFGAEYTLSLTPKGAKAS